MAQNGTQPTSSLEAPERKRNPQESVLPNVKPLMSVTFSGDRALIL